jgi:hypothetical protein
VEEDVEQEVEKEGVSMSAVAEGEGKKTMRERKVRLAYVR